jgi:hypothetical protein
MRSVLTVCTLFVILMSCKKQGEETEKKLELAEFATMFDTGKVYHIPVYKDTTTGADIIFNPPSDAVNRYVFEASFADSNARIYNEVTGKICFVHWEAYAHPQGWIVFEFVDLNLTPTYYRVTDYDIGSGYFIVQSGNKMIMFKEIR